MSQRPSHPQLVAALAKPGADVLAGLTPETAHLLHMAVGVSGEAGELLDAVKKASIYVKDLDINNVIEELGDLEFYMEGLRAALGITREECLAANIDKLSKRYHQGSYSNAQAQQRADKAVTGVKAPNSPFVAGDIVRYGDGITALARLHAPHAGGWHGDQCMGGSTFIGGRMYHATAEDFEIWNAQAQWRKGEQ